MKVFSERGIVKCSERCYRALLVLYPAQFRREFQREMVLVFRDSCHTALQRQGGSGLLRFWALTGYDLAITSGYEHYRNFILKLQHVSGKEKEFSMLSPLFQFNVAARSDIGCVRTNNEDSMLSVIPEDSQVLQEKGALFVVADGLGGHDCGEIASSLAASTLREAYYQSHESKLEDALKESVMQAHQALLRASEARSDSKPMATTCIAAVLHGNVLYVANVGDSRAYIVHQGEIRQISQDHSVVAEEVRKGTITEEEARTHPQRNVIYRSLGVDGKAEVDLFTERVQKGDVLFLCTDGLSMLVTDHEIRTLVEAYEPEECVERLIALAKERGGPDNITAVVVRVGAA